MKLWRVYFNRISEAPQVWSIDEGDQSTEINVIAVSFRDCEVISRTNLSEVDTESKPKAWFQARGTLRIERGEAIIEGDL